MKVLVVGGGGREHALAWKLAQSPRVTHVFVAPGNAGTAREPKIFNVAIAADDIDGLARFARAQMPVFTVVGPEAPLVLGIVDRFRAEGHACFGPVQAAAQLEGSKAYAKDFMRRYGIPTADYANFTELDAALAYLRAQRMPIVIKADGLAAGKGVIVAQTLAEAETAVRDMLAGDRFGSAGRRVVIEEFLSGEEASFIVMADGESALALASSQDHKRLRDGDQGPNTGGMGAYSPAPVVTPEVHARAMREVIAPVLQGMRAEGHAYTGFLYAGLMVSPTSTLKVLEFNCRFGDPETQPIMLRLQSDLADLIEAALARRLSTTEAQWDPRLALGVVMAAGGYPEQYRKDDAIEGLDAIASDVKVFHAGTALKDEAVVTSGGRVLCVTALGHDIAQAQARAYAAVAKISWPGAQYRRDIGARALARHAAGKP